MADLPEREAPTAALTHMIKPSSIRAALASPLILFTLLLALLPFTPARAADDFLDPDQAFQLSVRVLDAKRLELSYKVAPGYYLYRERFKFASPDAKLGEPQIPPGKKHYDTALEQNVETYHDGVVVVLPIASAGKSFTLNATHQGCADKGLCYPPQPRTVAVTLKAFGADADSAKIVADADARRARRRRRAGRPRQAQGGMSVAQRRAARSAAQRGVGAGRGRSAPQVDRAPRAPAPRAGARQSPPGHRRGRSRPADARRQLRSPPRCAAAASVLIVPLFFLAGLLLSLTPCVLPMVPILSSIIVGQGDRGHPLAAACCWRSRYSLGMALVYTALGVAAGLVGEGLAACLQNPVVLVSFARAAACCCRCRCSASTSCSCRRALRDGLSATATACAAASSAACSRWAALGADREPLRGRAARRGVLLYISQTGDAVLGRPRAVRARRGHERAAAAGRRLGRRAAAARRRLDGAGQARVRPAADRGGDLHRCSRCCRARRWRWRAGACC